MKKYLKTAFLLLIVAFLVLVVYVFYGYKTSVPYHILSFQDPKTQLFGFKDSDGKIFIDAQYQNSNTDTLFALAIVQKNNEWIGINTENEVILKPFIVDNGPDYLSEGLFRFVENGKIGFADIDGNKVIPAQFDFITPFENGIANYTLGGHKQFDSNNEHWSWEGGYEKGRIDKQGQKKPQ